MATRANSKMLRECFPDLFRMLPDHFPLLKNPEKALSSPPSPRYNCIAWAVDVDNAFWWPKVNVPGYFWPPGVPCEETIVAFQCAYATKGYVPIREADCENYEQVIALMGKDGKVTHAMKRLSNGLWSSKLGQSFDIVHGLHELDSPIYGTVIGFMGRGEKK